MSRYRSRLFRASPTMNVSRLISFICIIIHVNSVAYRTCAQSVNPFVIIDTVVEASKVRGIIKTLERTNDTLFEDDRFIVTKTCSGEWGGTIKFKSKENGTVYACAATCPVIVNKLNGKYIVTNSLSHLDGFCTVIP